MLLKLLGFVLLAQIAFIWGYPEKFIIKNKKTGLVLDGANENIGIGEWQNNDSQLWKLEDSATPGHYIVRNVANQKVLNACPITKILLAYDKHGKTNQRWKLDNGDTRLEVQFYPNHFVTHKDNKAVLLESKQSDDSDIWLLVSPPPAV